MLNRFSLICFLFGAASVACSSSGDADDVQSNVSGDEDGGGNSADCGLSFSSYAGDCLKLDAPAPGEGIQLHYGPSDYDDPAEVQRFLLPAGEELVDCQYMTSPNDAAILYDRYNTRMRPGTHHMILFAVEDPRADGEIAACDGLGGLGGRWIFAAQGGLDENGGGLDYPGDNVAPENEGLAFSLDGRTKIAYQLHYVNSTQEPILRESWSNIYFAQQSETTQLAAPITFFGGLTMAIAPGTNDVVTATCDAPADVRILDLWPHQHAHGVRFTVEKVTASGERSLIYETHEWAEPPTLYYDSTHQNKVPDATAGVTGGHTGLLTVSPGDRIEYECEIHNDSDVTLRFANEAYTAEMCNLFGSYTQSLGRSWLCAN